NFEIRKTLLKYDNVMNDQRKVIYEQRRDLMQASDVSQTVTEMRHDVINDMVARFIPENSYPEQWDTKGLHEESLRLLALDLPIADWAKEEGIDADTVRERILQASDRKMAEKAANFGPDIMRMAEKSLLLQLLDQAWKDHLLALDHLRHGIQLRAYGQRDPLNEYKREAFEMFEAMLTRLRETVTSVLSHIEIRAARPEDAMIERRAQPMQEGRSDPALAGAMAEPEMAMAGGGGQPSRPAARQGAVAPGAASAGATDPWGKTPRNAPCPCGSGKKYTHCHGKL